MPKKSLKELLESLSPEQTEELKEALKIEGSDTDLRETVIALQSDLKEILGIIKPKTPPKKKDGEGLIDTLETYLGVK